MPFTAFHIGAGLLGKGLAPKTQSLTFFTACQVAIDIEPGVRMLLGHGDLHTLSHHPAGLAVIVTASALAWSGLQRLSWWGRTRLPVLSRRALVDTAVWAGLTHLLLDAICHRDVWGSYVLFAGMDFAEDAALMMWALGLGLLGVRWLIGAARARLLRLRRTPQ
ncbi:MAG: hypothetical protein K2X75_03830 [Burkholderiaceae bacterium]|nr:hypothetical protein [Burkholderiaceae bacterium]